MALARFFFLARLAGFAGLIYGGGCVIGAAAVVACSGTTVGTGSITSCEGVDCPATDPFASLRDGAASDPADGGGRSSAGDAGMEIERDPSAGAANEDATVATPGAPCSRDVECTGGLCNLGTDTCEAPAPTGAKCWRDKECAGALCNLGTDTCAAPAPTGAKCWRDQECVSGLCNMSLDACE